MRKWGELLGAAIVLALLNACTTYPRWVSNNTGLTQQDFQNAWYQCLRETQQRVSNAYVNAYGGSAGSSVMPSCGAFNSCLAVHGFYQAQPVRDVSVFNRPGNYYMARGTEFQCSQ